MKVLIVEDEEDIRNLFCNFFSMLNFNYIDVGNGKDALKEIEHNKFDVIITDLRLPDVSGISIIKKIRETDNKCCIIVVSGFLDDETKKEALLSGASHYVEKPFSFKEIKSIIDSL